MTIPNNFRTTIGDKFFDKTISIYNQELIKNAHGGVRIADDGVSGTFVGNVNFSKLDTIREEYGINEVIDMTITTHEEVENETIIGYLDNQYKVIRSIPFDTHYLLIAQKWLSKSLTSISA